MNVYVYASNGVNWYGLSAFTEILNNVLMSGPTLSVAQAYAIDRKVDDGFPTTGTVIAQYINWNVTPNALVVAPNAAAASSSTCYDTTSLTYSTNQNGGAGQNCALSFQFQ